MPYLLMFSVRVCVSVGHSSVNTPFVKEEDTPVHMNPKVVMYIETQDPVQWLQGTLSTSEVQLISITH